MKGGRIACAAAALLLLGAAPTEDVERQRLVAARADAATAARRADALERDAAAERDAATRAATRRAALAARVRRAEADQQAAEARVAIVDGMLADQRATLATRQAPVARLLAALESLSRRPAIVAIAQPGSVDDLVHVRAVLGGALPVIRARTAALRADLATTRALDDDAMLAAHALADSRAELDGRRQALAALEAQHNERSVAFTRDALAQSDRAIAMGERARDLVDRISEQGGERATEAGLRSLAGPPPPPPEPATASDLPSAYRLPVAGRLATGLGEVSAAGVRSRGLTFAVASAAPVVAPAVGRVAYAGRFRSFGMIVILDHGDGWSTLVTGLGDAAVRRGTAVAAGALLGHAASGDDPSVTVELRRRGRPVDITALL